MSEQVLELSRAERSRSESVAQVESSVKSWGNSHESDDFDYIPVSPWGPIALVVGVVSLSGFYGMFGLGVAAVGVILGIVAVLRIREGAGTVKGTWFAVLGLVISTLCLTLGSAKMAYAYSTECPEGFRRVNFPREIAEKQFVYIGATRKLHPDVAPLIGTKVFLKGFMWMTQKSEGLTEFILLKDNGECCFGGKAQPYDMMLIKLQDGLTTRAYTGMVAVAGVLHADLAAGEDAAVYTIDATLVEEAQTGF